MKKNYINGTSQSLHNFEQIKQIFCGIINISKYVN